MPVVRIPDEQFERLKGHAEPLVDGVGDVIGRLLDFSDRINGPVYPISSSDTSTIWFAIARAYNDRDPKFYANVFPPRNDWMQVLCGRWDVHYEWVLRKSPHQAIEVALHYEAHEADINARRLAALIPNVPGIRNKIKHELVHGSRKIQPTK